MPTETASSNYIVLTEELLSDLSGLKSLLSELYLGPSQVYELQFPYSHLRSINKIFDDIIFRYKIREVSFQFVFRNEKINPSLLQAETTESHV